jgi:hypothetical protein
MPFVDQSWIIDGDNFRGWFDASGLKFFIGWNI